MATVYDIRGAQIHFPYAAYAQQLAYMDKVVLALQQGTNALLESPTGTGKTLSLLCATLAWRQSHTMVMYPPQYNASPNNASVEGFVKSPKIVYASRTHSQLTQVISELSKTIYKPKVKVLGSREQLCVHPDVMKLSSNAAKTAVCKHKVTRKACPYYAKVAEAVKQPIFKEAILDIEDLVKLGLEHQACPYFMSREALDSADLLFMPYNYLIDPKIRSSITHMNAASSNGTISNFFQDAVLIFDEAHNLENSCSDAFSFDWSLFDLEKCLKELSNPLAILNSPKGKNIPDGSTKTVENRNAVLETPISRDASLSTSLCNVITRLIEKLGSLLESSPSGSVCHSGTFLYDLMRSIDVSRDFEMNETIKGLTEAVTNASVVNYSGSLDMKLALSGLLESFCILYPEEHIQSNSCRQHASNYKIYLEYLLENNLSSAIPNKRKWQGGAPGTSDIGKKKWKLNYWCFHPGLALMELKQLGVRSILLTSGTLSPLASLERDYEIPFKQRLENTHVIQSNQVFSSVLSQGPTHITLDSSYANRLNASYALEAGLTLVELTKVIPNGILVFFPSYGSLSNCVSAWKLSNRQNSAVYEQLEKRKKVFIEPKDKLDFQHALNDYYRASKHGAIFMGICRGKISEGIDFSDDKCRAVVIIGIPFPALKEPRIALKKSWLDERKSNTKDKNKMTGQEWYFHQAVRAVNQSIGRVLRHSKDYGAILLCDYRFGAEMKDYLPLWSRSLTKKESMSECLDRLGKFFESHHKVSTPINDTKREPSYKLSSRNVTLPSTTSISVQEPLGPDGYLRHIKSLLTPEDFLIFKTILLTFKRERFSIPELLKQLGPLFDTYGEVLRQGFKAFVPPLFHSLFLDQLTEGGK